MTKLVNDITKTVNQYFGLILTFLTIITVFLGLWLKTRHDNTMLALDLMEERSHRGLAEQRLERGEQAFCDCLQVLKEQRLRLGQFYDIACKENY